MIGDGAVSAAVCGSAAAIRYLEKYIAQWRDDAYFFDVLDKLARDLILKRQWEDMANVCAILRSRPNAALAKYAWIIGRAVEEGLYAPKKTAPLAGPTAYRRVAYDAGLGSLYYRSLSAAALGEPSSRCRRRRKRRRNSLRPSWNF